MVARCASSTVSASRPDLSESFALALIAMGHGFLSTLVSSIGTFVILKQLYKFATFLSLYLTAPGVQKFVHGRAPYALVTGATDGIGKETAKELYQRGFNIILHGRNAQKLDKVKEEIKQMGSREVRVWAEDASRAQIDFEKVVRQWDDIEITLVVHNVGGVIPREPRSAAALLSCRT